MSNVRPPRLLFAVVVLWLVIIVVTFSDAGVPFPIWMAVSAASVGLTVCALVRLALTYKRAAPRWWILTFILIAAGFALESSSKLLSVRLYLSAGALQKSGPSLAAIPSEDLYTHGRWVGLFHVKEFAQFGSELRFITNDCGVVDSCGIVFSPDGPPPNRGEDSFSHLYGPWWHWYQSF
jgi:hypothetical protein